MKSWAILKSPISCSTYTFSNKESTVGMLLLQIEMMKVSRILFARKLSSYPPPGHGYYHLYYIFSRFATQNPFETRDFVTWSWYIFFLLIYRPGQHNWEYTICKFQYFSATQILHEINFGHFEAPKSANLNNSAALNLEFLGIFDISQFEIFPKIKMKSLENC